MHVVFITSGMTSFLNSALALAGRLQRRGHRVSFVGQTGHEGRVEPAGFPFHPLAFDVEAQSRWDRADSEADRAEIRRESLLHEEIEETLTAIGAELLLIDIELHYAIIATRRLDLPTFLTTVWFPPFRSRGLPPMNTALFPARGPLGRLKVALSWERIWLRSWRSELMRALRRQSNRARRRPVGYRTRDVGDLRELASSRGWDFRRGTTRRHWMLPHSYSDLEVISYTAREMDFPSNEHRLAHHVGPMVDGRRLMTASDEDRHRWEEFLAGWDRRPLVYCSLGTFWEADTRLLREIIDVFERRRDWALVVGLGGKASIESLGDLPENVVVLDWAPQLAVISQSSCVITHGGISTINECVVSGVPMLVYSTSHVDQDGCAARVAFHGLGISEDRSSATSASIERNVASLLADEGTRERIAAMRASLDRYILDQKAEHLIERSLSTGRVGAGP